MAKLAPSVRRLWASLRAAPRHRFSVREVGGEVKPLAWTDRD